MAVDRNYNDEEVRAIIDRALRLQHDRDFDHEQLLAVASEVGISRDNVEAAVREHALSREMEQAKLGILGRRRRRLMSHLWAFGVVNMFLFAINYLSTPGEWWVLFPLLSWGLGLLFHARAALSKHVSERAMRRERKRLHAEREALNPSPASRTRVQSGNLGLGAAEFGSAVQEGVGRLLARAAAELRAATPPPKVRVESPSAPTEAQASQPSVQQKQRAGEGEDAARRHSDALESAVRRNQEPG